MADMESAGDILQDVQPRAPFSRWLVDVKEIWPHPKNDFGKKSTAEWGATPEVKCQLDILLPEEKARVLRFFHVRDAKLCLASYILKRRAVVQACGVPWSQAVLSEDHNRRPCYKSMTTSGVYFDFNVSHHGTLVALVGCTKPKVRVGIDIVQIPWDKDLPLVLQNGFEDWITTYRDIFSRQEIADMINYPINDGTDDMARSKVKLRSFYTHWCLKEAFIKMKGEALLASWLKDLEFRNVTVPSLADGALDSDDSSSWTGRTTSVEVWLYGRLLTDVTMELQALGEDYLFATSVSESDVCLPHFDVQEVGDPTVSTKSSEA